MKLVMRFLAWVAAGITLAALFGFVAVGLIFAHYNKGLPSFEKLAEYSPPVVTRLYAADGRLLAEYAKEKRIFVPLSSIPLLVQQAFLAAEDKNFYEHKGVDFMGTLRAVRENIANYGSGRSMVGGSTITQQVVKNFLLTSEKSFERKIKEAILAYRISQVYTKDQILELYLNQIYLGRGSYGVAAAALNYFDKPLNELLIEEAAMLAALPKAPNSYNPHRNYEGALSRRNYVLGRMQEDNYLTPEAAQRAKSSPILIHERSENDMAAADFFAEEVRRWIADKYGSDVLYEGGLTVKTTVNPDMQKHADKALRAALVAYDRRYGYRGSKVKLPSVVNWEIDFPARAEEMDVPLYDGQMLAVVLELPRDKAVIGLSDGKKASIPFSELQWARKDLPNLGVGPAIRQPSDVLAVGDVIIAQPLKDKKDVFGLAQIPEVNGAMVVMDPHTGRVLAMSGGYSFSGSEFNRATQAKRQPGSAFKPIVYLTALENGFTPATMLNDSPIEISQGPGLPLWRPQNFGGSFLGAITLRTGLEKSRNTLTVRMAQMLGIGRVINVAKRLGVYDGKVPKNYSMVLGAHETTLMRMVTAYAMIANGGRRVKEALVERVDDRDGSILFRRDDRQCVGCQVPAGSLDMNASPPIVDDAREVVIDPRVAYQLTEIMEGVVKRGTATRALSLGRPIAGKTGTTNDSRDAWFIGFTPDLVTGVYIGYDQPRNMGRNETGGGLALPGFINFMAEAMKDIPAKPFSTPEGVMIVQVDRNTGLPPYPGAPAGGALIPEVFVVGGNIYKPALPEDAEEEGILQAQDPDAIIESGFDPYAGWEDTDYYMSPQKAQMLDQQYQGQQGAQPVPENPALGFGEQLPPPAPAPQDGGYDIYQQPAPTPPAVPFGDTPLPPEQPSGGAGMGGGTGALY